MPHLTRLIEMLALTEIITTDMPYSYLISFNVRDKRFSKLVNIAR
jgi:hypothetical protein